MVQRPKMDYRTPTEVTTRVRIFYPHNCMWLKKIIKKSRGTYKLTLTEDFDSARVFWCGHLHDDDAIENAIRTVIMEHNHMNETVTRFQVCHIETRDVQPTGWHGRDAWVVGPWITSNLGSHVDDLEKI